MSVLFFLPFLFYFSFGALLPLIPKLSLETAGWAFSAYYLFKVLWYIPAGPLSDKIGHYRALVLALVAQLLAFVVLLLRPEWSVLARALEGMALAQGTISSLSALRLNFENAEEFSRAVNRLMVAGSVGFLLGPLFGFVGYSVGSDFLLGSLIAVTVLGLLLTVKQALPKPAAIVVAMTGDPDDQQRVTGFWGLIIGMAAVKCVSIGWQPNMAWWAPEVMGQSPLLSGLSFVTLGVFFALGALRPSALDSLAGILGFICLELALVRIHELWWPGLILLGYWFGSYVTFTTGKLGWNRPDRVGARNSFWLVLTDLPSAFVPLLLWQWRDPAEYTPRIILGGSLLIVAFFSVLKLRRFRAATGNSQV